MQYRWTEAALFLGLLLAVAAGAAAAPRALPIAVALNGQVHEFTPSPIEVEGRVLVPVREVLESAGATVHWDAEDRIVTVIRQQHRAVLVMDHRTISADGRPVVLDVAPRTIGGRAYVPLRAVAQALGGEVRWNAARRMVLVTAPRLPQQVARVERYEAPPEARPS